MSHKLWGLQWWFVTTPVPFWQWYQKQECNQSAATSVAALQWRSMITCQHYSRASLLRAHPGESLILLTPPGLAPCSPPPILIPRSVVPALSLRSEPALPYWLSRPRSLQPLRIPVTQALFPRAFKCFTAPLPLCLKWPVSAGTFHHGSQLTK